MNQDGNTAMPQKPDFSSPNSPDAGQQQIAAAAASMTESDPKQAITSAPSNNGASAHGMFGNRRFKAKKDATPTSFAGAPDFFSQAAGGNSQDFVTIGNAPAKRSSNKKLFIIGGVLLVALVIVLAISFIPGAVQRSQASDRQKKLHEAWHKMGCKIIRGEDDCEISTDEGAFIGWHIPSENSDLISARDAAEEFITFSENNKIEGIDYYADAANEIISLLKALTEIDSFSESEYENIADAVLSREYNEENLNTIVYSGYSKDLRVSSTQELITDYAMERYRVLDYYFNNGCNTEELLFDDDCGVDLVVPDDIRLKETDANHIRNQIAERRADFNNEIITYIYNLNRGKSDDNE